MRNKLTSAIFLCFLMLFCIRKTQAMDLYSYDLDSLTYMSTEIVEGHLARHYVASTGLDLVDIKISAVYKGAFKPGQTVAVTATDFFRKESTDLFRTKPLEPGDHVVLFLVKAHNELLYNIPEDADIYWPVPSGIKLIQGSQTLSFHQFSNPGPYIAVSPATDAKVRAVTLEELRDQLRQSILKTDALVTLLTSPVSDADIPRLLSLIRSRANKEAGFFGRDEIAERACTKLADLHDYPVLASLLLTSLPPLISLPPQRLGWSQGIIIGGFGTPAGRDYLLRQVSDQEQPLAQRVQFAGVIAGAGGVYYAHEATPFFSSKLQPKDQPINGGYYVRIAELAWRTRNNKQLCQALVSVLNNFAGTIDGTYESGVHEKEAGRVDLKAAAPTLTALYYTADSPEVKYDIEQILWIANPALYDSLHPAGGSILSILTSVGSYEAIDGRRLTYNYSHRVLEGGYTGLSWKILLTDLSTHQQYQFPIGPVQSVVGEERGGGSVLLPKDFPNRVYQACPCFFHNGKQISTGYSYDVTLKAQ